MTKRFFLAETKYQYSYQDFLNFKLTCNSKKPEKDLLKDIQVILIHEDFLDKKLHQARVSELLISVGLQPSDSEKYPHEFSGGQRQRIAIARALALNPEIIICDEAVSALDVSIQAQIIKLLKDLRNQFSLSYIFIAHDLPVVRELADRVIVMKSGKILEEGNVDDVFNTPINSYTMDLLRSSPSIEKLFSN